jgi:DNA repair exonuclease SbcCD ATPase subunit
MSIKETEAARLKKELEAERKRLEFARNAERVQREEAERLGHQLIAARGQMTKLRNRVGKGVCPCCNRSFENLKRHMVSKHPDYAAGELPAEG